VGCASHRKGSKRGGVRAGCRHKPRRRFAAGPLAESLPRSKSVRDRFHSSKSWWNCGVACARILPRCGQISRMKKARRTRLQGPICGSRRPEQCGGHLCGPTCRWSRNCHCAGWLGPDRRRFLFCRRSFWFGHGPRIWPGLTPGPWAVLHGPGGRLFRTVSRARLGMRCRSAQAISLGPRILARRYGGGRCHLTCGRRRWGLGSEAAASRSLGEKIQRRRRPRRRCETEGQAHG